MPRTCCVPGCNSNLRSRGAPSVTTFTFPKDEERRKLWLQCIKREDYVPTNSSAVCIHHFREDLIIREISATREDGLVLVVPRERPKLADNAYPSLFLSRLPSQSPRKRRVNRQHKEDCMMPRTCCVPGCNSNLRSRGAPSVTTFAFPKDEERKKLWLQCIEREDYVPTNSSAVCIHHFREDMIIREISATREDGLVPVVPRERPKLADDAYPSLFLCRLLSQSPRKRRVNRQHKEDCMKEDHSRWSGAKDKCGVLISIEESNSVKHAEISEDEARSSRGDSEAQDASVRPRLRPRRSCASRCSPVTTTSPAPAPSPPSPSSSIHPPSPAPPKKAPTPPEKATDDFKCVAYTGGMLFACPECPALFKLCTSAQEHRLLHERLSCVSPSEGGPAAAAAEGHHEEASRKRGEEAEERPPPIDSQADDDDDDDDDDEEEEEEDLEKLADELSAALLLRTRGPSSSSERGAPLPGKTKRNKTYVCDVCEEVFPSFRELRTHRRVAHKTKAHCCDTCGKCFQRASKLKVHMRVHSKERPYRCETCGARFTQCGNLKTHVRTHSGERPFSCEVCHASFMQPSHLKVHRRCHTGERPYACHLCPAAFTQLTSLILHKRSHTGERPFACDACDLAFNSRGDLKVHKRRHTGERPYRCDVCEASFTTVGTLNVHKRRHAGKRSYLCDVCGVAFITHSELKTHKRRHTGEQPYRCDVCGTAFTQVGSLNTHKKRHKESAVAATAAGSVTEDALAGMSIPPPPPPFPPRMPPPWHLPTPPLPPAPLAPLPPSPLPTIPWAADGPLESGPEKGFTAAMMCFPTTIHSPT